MQPFLRLPAWFTAWLLAPALLYAAPPSDMLISEFVHLSGIDKQLREVEAFAASEIDNRKDALDNSDYLALRRTLVSAFDADALLASASAVLKSRGDAEKLAAWIARLKTPVMSAMFDLEEAATRGDNYSEIMAYARMLELTPPSPERLALITRLDQATGASALAFDSQLAVLRTLLIAINPSLPDNQQMDAQRLDNVLEQTRMQLEEALQNVATITYLYTYRDVDNETLETYVATYESELGQWAVSLIQDAIRTALRSAANEPTVSKNPS